MSAAGGIFERTIDGLLGVVQQSLYAERAAAASGFLQRRDARAKLVSIVVLLLGVSFSRNVAAISALLALALVTGHLSRISVSSVLRSASLPVLLVGVTLALPALFLTPGDAVVTLIPGVAITGPGVRVASLLIARLLAAATLALLLVLSTPWPALLNALRALGMPPVIVVIFGMTYRYIHLLLKTAHDMFVARRSRMLAVPRGRDSRRIVVRTAGVLFARSLDDSQRIFDAMTSRGFRGDVRLLTPHRLVAADWLLAATSVLVAAAVALAGRTP